MAAEGYSVKSVLKNSFLPALLFDILFFPGGFFSKKKKQNQNCKNICYL